MRPSPATSIVLTAILIVAALAPVPARTAIRQDPPPGDPLHRPLDEILDVYVRDGLVYYRALKSERGKLDRYIASLDVSPATYDGWPRERKMAFWLNAYNVFVLRTVIDNYPIRARVATYPANSIRQIPGAFEQARHRAAGRAVSLDDIEKTIVAEFKEPRVHLAFGRGARGSGRLRSEAYDAGRLARQLDQVQAEFVTEAGMLTIDRAAGVVSVTPIVSWNADAFVAAYDKAPDGPFARRSPVERALVEFVMPHLLPMERDFVRRNEFKLTYHPFDWTLNDLTGR